MRTLLVTGASGFIGSTLVANARAAGWRAITAARSGATEGDARAYDLGRHEIEESLLDEVDVVVHAAHIRSSAREGGAHNITGTLALADAAKRRGIPFLFLSSLAAHDGALSTYGKQKFAIERALHGSATIVRPGLVLGNGGLFGRIRAHLRSNTIVPLIEGGRQPLQTVHVDDLATVLLHLASTDAPVEATVAEAVPTSYAEFFSYARELFDSKAQFLHLPYWPVVAVARIAARLSLSLPVDEDNVLGLRAMRAFPVTTDPALVPIHIRTYRESLSAIKEAEKNAPG